MSVRICSRSAVTDRSIIDEDKRTIRTVLTTDAPAKVIDWSRWEVVREILLMKGAILPENKQVPLLDNHSRQGAVATVIKGSVRDLRVEGKELIGVTHFSELADKEWTLVKEGHLDSVSVGYETYDDETVELKRGAVGVVDGVEYRNDYADGLPLLIRKKWRSLEGSLVPIGADAAAKFRSIMDNEQLKMDNEKGKIQINKEERTIAMEPTKENTVEVSKVDETKAERERATEIINLGAKFNMHEESQRAIAEGMSADAFKNQVLEKVSSQKAAPTNPFKPVMNEKERKGYSISRAILSLINDSNVDAGFEKEVSRQLEMDYGRRAAGILLPYDILGAKAALTATGEDTGDKLIGTAHMGEAFIDLLRNVSVLVKAGARVMFGLRDNIEIPKMLTGATAGFYGENDSVSEGNPTFTNLTMTPKRAAVHLQYSTLLLKQNNPAIDSILLNDALQSLGLLIDKAGLVGVSNGPTSILGTAGINAVDGGSFNKSKALELISKVMEANAIGVNMYHVMNPTIWALLRSRAMETGHPTYLIDQDNKLAGYDTIISNQMASVSKIIYGDFTHVLQGYWGAMDLIADPFTNAKTGLINLTIAQYCDQVVRHAGAFSVANDVS